MARALQAVIFSSPGSPGLPRIMSTVKARGWSARLLLQDLSPSASRPAPRLSDLILVPRGPRKAARPSVARKRQRTIFADALARDIAQYSAAAQRVGHAAEI